MDNQGSAVVEVMKQAAVDSWKKWRDHVRAGTGGTPEGLAAFDAANIAGAAWLGEVAQRARAA